jgi:hypothetical protein
MTHRAPPTTQAKLQRAYERARDLPRLLPLWPHELHTPSPDDHARLLARIRRALRLERQRGIAGHWTYDVARHADLLRAYRSETANYRADQPNRPSILKASAI